MRDVNFYLAFVLSFGLTMGTGAAFAAESVNDDLPAAEENQQSDDISTQKNPIRPNLQSGFMSKPITAKKIYREAWNMDNWQEMSTVEQLEYFRKNGPRLDPDLEIIMDNGIKLMKKMNYGMKDKDLSESTKAIQDNPARAIQDLSENVTIEASPAEILEIAAETSEASQRLREKIYKNKPLGKTDYPIDVDSF